MIPLGPFQLRVFCDSVINRDELKSNNFAPEVSMAWLKAAWLSGGAVLGDSSVPVSDPGVHFFKLWFFSFFLSRLLITRCEDMVSLKAAVAQPVMPL